MTHLFFINKKYSFSPKTELCFLFAFEIWGQFLKRQLTLRKCHVVWKIRFHLKVCSTVHTSFFLRPEALSDLEGLSCKGFFCESLKRFTKDQCCRIPTSYFLNAWSKFASSIQKEATLHPIMQRGRFMNVFLKHKHKKKEAPFMTARHALATVPRS